jgi:hypothetical protein
MTGGMCPAKYSPRLHSFALDNSLSVKELIQYEDRLSLFYLPLSQQAFEEYNLMQECLNGIVINQESNDVSLTVWKNGL